MENSIHDYVVARLAGMPIKQVLRVSRDTGISESTIRKIKYRQVKNPGVSLVERLNKYFRGQPSV